MAFRFFIYRMKNGIFAKNNDDEYYGKPFVAKLDLSSF